MLSMDFLCKIYTYVITNTLGNMELIGIKSFC
ncbi:MAG: hypothetical protein Q607_CBUC00159G0002, partial [Clostridium butyricum DORA_1]